MAQLGVLPVDGVFDEILDPSIRLRVAGLLVSFPEKEFTGREIAGFLGVAHSNVQSALRVLVEDGLASMKRIGRANVVWANKDHFSFKALSGLFRVRRELSDRIVGDLRSAFRDSGQSVTVFGSYARGEAVRRSDMDVLVVAKDRGALEDRVGGIEAAFARKYGIHLSVKVLSPSELRSRPVPSYLRAAAKEGILVSGVPIQRVMASGK